MDVDFSAADTRAQMEKYMTMMAGFVRAHDPKAAERAYANNEDLVLRHGEWFTPRRLPRPYRYRLPRQCYMNSTNLVINHPHLTYVEGFAWCGGIPTSHAWCVDERGLLIDATWNPDAHTLAPVESWVYVGVRFTRAALQAVLASKDEYSVLEDWQRDYPLLEAPFSMERVMEIYQDLGRGERRRAQTT